MANQLPYVCALHDRRYLTKCPDCVIQEMTKMPRIEAPSSKSQLTLAGEGGMGGELYFEHASDSFAVNLNGQLMFLSESNAKALRDYLNARLAAETPAEPKNWAIWHCMRHGRLFSAHAGCSMCVNDPDPSSSNAPKTNGEPT